MSFQTWLIQKINPLFTASDWVDVLESSDQRRILAATERSGEVVLSQFHGYNDLRGQDILDLGCGSAGKTLHYAKQGARRVFGVDVVVDHAGPAIAEAKSLGLDFNISRITPENGIPLPDNSVDVVLSSSVLEHLPDLSRSLNEVRRVLRPGGLFLNRWHPYSTRFGSHLNSVIGIPFAHRVFSEKALMAAYFDYMISRHGHIPAAVSNIKRNGELNDIMFMNRLTLRQAHRSFDAAGFKRQALRYFRGMREMHNAARLPPAFRPAVVDYEVNILRKA